MSPLPRLLLAGVAFAIAVLAGGAAEDKATKQARHHFERGEKLFALGRFQEALVEYEAAFELRPLPGFLFNIGQCHRNLGDYDAAIFSFRKYLELSPGAANREAVEGLIEELEGKKADAEAARQNRILDGPDPRRRPDRPRRADRPVYKRWWFWGGVAAVAGAGAGTYLWLRDDGVPDTDLGNVVFR
jgi:tetratricopeptide (TPR) repeat protein